MISKKYIRVLFILYLLVLLRVIVFKESSGNGVNFELFRTIKLYVRQWNHKGMNSDIFGNLIGNVLAFIPLGYMLPRLFKIFENVFVCMAAALLFILGIELFQLFSALGIFDVDDILLNGLGVLIGYLGFALVKILLKRKEKKNEKL